MEKFKKLIEEYNKGLDVEGFFAKLTAFVKELSQEEKRGVTEKLSEEELALFDILTKPEIDMTKAEKEAVKKVARNLLQTLKEAKLVSNDIDVFRIGSNRRFQPAQRCP